MSGLTSDRVLRSKFKPTRFRVGYDQDEVDDFLDTVVLLLKAHEQGAPMDAVAAAELCRGARFTTTKFREGYDMGEVDDLLATLSTEFSLL